MNSRRQDLVVVLDAPELGEARPVGVLTRWPGAILSVAFEYARSWLDDVERNFPIDPFRPERKAARAVIADVADAVSEWRSMTSTVGIGRREQDQVAVALSALPSAATL